MPWKGIGKRLRELFRAREFDEEFFHELEDAMIEADMGVRTASEAVGRAARGGAQPGGSGSPAGAPRRAEAQCCDR